MLHRMLHWVPRRTHQGPLLAQGRRLTLGLVLILLLAACGTEPPALSPTAVTAPPAATDTTAAAAAATNTTVVAPTTATTAAPANPISGDKILFGAPLGLTGSLAKESKLTQQGYDLWAETVNKAGGIDVGGKKYQVAIKYYDDQSKQDLSAQLAEKLINEDHVQFLLGPYGTSATQSTAAIAEKYEIPMVEGEGAAEKIFSQSYKYTFGTLSPAKNYLKGVIEMAAAQTPKPQRVVILSANDSFSVEVADGAKAVAEANGLTVVDYIKYPNAETDLTAQVTQAKGDNPDLVLNSGHFAEAVAIVKAMKELGVSPAGAGFSVGPSLPDFKDTLKADADYVYGGAQWTKDLKYQGNDYWKTPQAYFDAFTARWGNEPSYQSAMATACGLVFQKALEKTGSLDPKKLRDAIAATDFMSFAGQMKFDARGINTVKPMVVEQWQNGAKQTVWPTDVASGKPMWPTPAWGKR
jgi:branched-chain amino acid transport system substrate-binding protein